MAVFEYIKSLFKKKTYTQQLLSYNIADLSSQMDSLSIDIFRCRTEDSMRVLKKVVQTARNIQLLETNRAEPSKVMHHIGRLDALSDLAAFIEMSLDPEIYSRKVEKQAPRTKLLVRNNPKSNAVI
jgi:hypothetical protein